MRTLRMYKLKRHVSISAPDPDWRVWVAFGAAGGEDRSGADSAAATASSSMPSPLPLPSSPSPPPPNPPSTSEGSWSVDPRLPELGWRGVFKGRAPQEHRGHGAGGGAVPVGGDVLAAYKRWRYLNGVAEGHAEMGGGARMPVVMRGGSSIGHS